MRSSYYVPGQLLVALQRIERAVQMSHQTRVVQVGGIDSVLSLSQHVTIGANTAENASATCLDGAKSVANAIATIAPAHAIADRVHQWQDS